MTDTSASQSPGPTPRSVWLRPDQLQAPLGWAVVLVALGGLLLAALSGLLVAVVPVPQLTSVIWALTNFHPVYPLLLPLVVLFLPRRWGRLCVVGFVVLYLRASLAGWQVDLPSPWLTLLAVSWTLLWAGLAWVGAGRLSTAARWTWRMLCRLARGWRRSPSEVSRHEPEQAASDDEPAAEEPEPVGAREQS